MQSLLNLIESKNRYKILSASTHERYQSDMDQIDADFYLYSKAPHIKSWNNMFAKLPENHYILPEQYFPAAIPFDFVLSQNRFGQYQQLAPIAAKLQIPLVNIEHTLPLREWPNSHFQQIKQLRGHVNLYISNFSAKIWEEPAPIIVRHCVNTDLFRPANLERYNHILTVANDYPGRDSVLGFTQYLKVTKDLPTKPVGDSPGFSKAAKSTEELAEIYSTSRIFLNTSTWSPIPKSLLEAMSSGCAVVSSNNCEIPYYIDHGINGMLANSDQEMREYLELLINDDKLSNFLGENARKTILEKCSKNDFTKQWNHIFKSITRSQTRSK